MIKFRLLQLLILLLLLTIAVFCQYSGKKTQFFENLQFYKRIAVQRTRVPFIYFNKYSITTATETEKKKNFCVCEWVTRLYLSQMALIYLFLVLFMFYSGEHCMCEIASKKIKRIKKKTESSDESIICFSCFGIVTGKC